LSRYIHRGNSKFGAITIENLEQDDLSSLTYRLFVDGVEAWNTTVLSPTAVAETKKASFWERLRNK
jgi:alkaline phosphatase D